MANKNVVKHKKAERRRRRVRSRVTGTPDCPRLCVARTLNHVYVQIIDDIAGLTLAGVSSNSNIIKADADAKDTKAALARKVGIKAAEMAKAKGIETVVFDRNRFPFHGRVKAVADGAREGGLKF
ncbi:MAG: 50S ribosomal protein L18 [Candidatus Zixiibacteriota bacterium]|nr:MAG: 50S ribosomal protein L18 [candidate division Zixibacteria bacterium]